MNRTISLNANDSAKSFPILKDRLVSILDLFDKNSRIFYIDYPIHSNVGDSLINLGTEKFFVEHGITISKRYNIFNMPKMSELKSDKNITFLCNGGGNFGDLYPNHQHMREYLINNFPKARIIFMPQSLYYSSKNMERTSLKNISKHPNCHILVRDAESLQILHNNNIFQSSLMPDMAHQLWGTFPSTHQPQNGSALYFLRKDREKTPIPSEIAGFISNPVDWNTVISLPHRINAASTHYFLKIGGPILPSNFSASTWYSVRDKIVSDGVAYFSRYEKVYTNRLHAMLLALMLGRDVVAFDNSYGKLSRYIDTWLKPTSLA